MIRLFVVDLDGCISHPFQTPHWEAINAIRTYNIAGKTDTSIPPLTICTGRPLPYAEAVAQWLCIDLPFAFESGAGLYHTAKNRLDWAPEITLERLHAIDELKRWAQSDIIPRFPGTVAEFTKRCDIGFIHPVVAINHQIRETVQPYVEANYPDFEVHDTDVSVNIILSDCNKGSGVRFLSDRLEIPLSQIAYIGDSSGDIPAMKLVQRSFAPSNAREVVKPYAELIDLEATEATREAYERLINSNRNQAS